MNKIAEWQKDEDAKDTWFIDFYPFCISIAFIEADDSREAEAYVRLDGSMMDSFIEDHHLPFDGNKDIAMHQAILFAEKVLVDAQQALRQIISSQVIE